MLTGFLICGHAWDDKVKPWINVGLRWRRRVEQLMWSGTDGGFSASRLFAAVYPEALDVAELIAAPAWRARAASDAQHQQQFFDAVTRRLDHAGYETPAGGDAITHWMKYDSWRPPSRPDKTFPGTREHGTVRAAAVSPHTVARQDRSAFWFQMNQNGGSVILHHRHIRPVLVRDWSTSMQGITATIWASRTTTRLGSLSEELERERRPVVT